MPRGHSFLAPGVGPVTAIESWQVEGDRRQRALPQHAARAVLTGLATNASHVALEALHGLARGVERDPIRGLDAAALLPAVDAAIESGTLLLFAGWETGSDGLPSGGGEVTGPSQDTLLATRIMRGNRAILFQGYRYRFVAAGDRSTVFEGADEAPVPLNKARAITEAMSEKMPRNGMERDAWKDLAERLTDKERVEGIRLMRINLGGGHTAPADLSEAVSPSAMRAAVAEKAWIEVKVLYEDGSPFTGNVVIELPDGRKTEGAPDAAGIIRIDSIDPGSCKVSIPDLDASAWKAA